MTIFTPYTTKRSSLIKNRNILQNTFIPNQLPHREKEIKDIVEIISPILSNEKPSNILVTGRPGTGKTAVLNFIGRELKETDPKEENCCFVYVNCEIVDIPISMLYNISNQIIKEYDEKIPFTGWSFDKVYYTLTDYMDKQNKTYLIVLDEIDRALQKRGEDIFYYLTNMNEILKKSKVSVIGVTNNTRFQELLGTKIKSRLGEEKIVFHPYTPSQITDILIERASCAFEDGIIEDGVIQYCAAVVANDSGDARKALDLLRVAADIADRNGDSKITEAHARSAKARIEMDAVLEVIKTLPSHSKIVLMSIVRKNEDSRTTLFTGEVYSEYRELCAMLDYTDLGQRRVSDLISELDSLGMIHAKVKSFGRAGRTKEINLSISGEAIRVLSEDEIFKSIKPSKKQMTLI